MLALGGKLFNSNRAANKVKCRLSSALRPAPSGEIFQKRFRWKYHEVIVPIDMGVSVPLWIIFILIFGASISGEFINDQHHQTEGAKLRKNDLWCYKCDTMDDGDKCSNLSAGNESKLVYKCPEQSTICMVKRYSYTTSTENSTSVLRMWSLQRNCTQQCEPGCIVIGERTKLYACTACCHRSLCNTGRGHSTRITPHLILFIVNLLIIFISYHNCNYVNITHQNNLSKIKHIIPLSRTHI